MKAEEGFRIFSPMIMFAWTRQEAVKYNSLSHGFYSVFGMLMYGLNILFNNGARSEFFERIPSDSTIATAPWLAFLFSFSSISSLFPW